MPVSIVVGGQFGSEGKGKVAHFLAKERRARFAVRVGGSNSGHTVIDRMGNASVFRHLPTACLLPRVVSVLPPGNYLHVPTLLKELDRIGAQPGQVAIDPHAWIVQEDDIRTEVNARLKKSIGSTATGTGAALARRLARRHSGTFAKDIPELRGYIRETNALLAAAIKDHQRIIVEGTQGFGLSMLHSGQFPYCTSRDTTAAGFLSEAGLSPLDVDDVVLVIRAFPIRVAGSSGPLPNEIDWTTVTKESGSPKELIEYTTVTQRVRRVAKFDPVVVKQAINHNRPTCIVLNHLDYIDAACSAEGKLSRKVDAFVRSVERSIGAEISLLGFSPSGLRQHGTAPAVVQSKTLAV